MKQSIFIIAIALFVWSCKKEPRESEPLVPLSKFLHVSTIADNITGISVDYNGSTNVVCVSTDNGKIYESTDNGNTWTSINAGSPSDMIIDVFYDGPHDAIACFNKTSNDFLVTQDNGSTWDTIALPQDVFNSVFFGAYSLWNHAFAWSDTALYKRATGVFASWTQVYSPPQGITILDCEIRVTGAIILNSNYEILVSNASFSSWEHIATEPTGVRKLRMHNTYGYYISNSNIMYSYSLPYDEFNEYEFISNPEQSDLRNISLTGRVIVGNNTIASPAEDNKYNLHSAPNGSGVTGSFRYIEHINDDLYIATTSDNKVYQIEL